MIKKDNEIEVVKFSHSGNDYYNEDENHKIQGCPRNAESYARYDAVPKDIKEYKHTPDGELRPGKDSPVNDRKTDVTINDLGYMGGLKAWKPKGRSK